MTESLITINVRYAEQIALVACVGQKLDHPAPAADLYQSVWFKKARRYAELVADRWYILSAHHHLVDPAAIIAPYDFTLAQASGSYRRRWSANVLHDLIHHITLQDQITILAGKPYHACLARWLQALGYTIEIPMQGLGIGQQLRWLNQQIEYLISNTQHPAHITNSYLPTLESRL
jgi:hypothetical protein